MWSFQNALQDSKLYLQELDRLETWLQQKGLLYSSSQEDVGFFNFSFEKKNVAQRIAKTIAMQKYQLQPGQMVVARRYNKVQQRYDFSITDQLVHNVIAELINERLNKVTAGNVLADHARYSIVPLVQRCSQYIHENLASEQQELYAWHGIFMDYPEQISVVRDSVIWSLVTKLLDISMQDLQKSYHGQLLEQTLRPQLLTQDELPYQSLFIIPSDAKVAAALDALYLYDFDYHFEQQGGFYMRCSREFLFIHSDPELVRMAAERANSILTALGVKLQTELSQFCRLTPQKNATKSWFYNTNKIRFWDFWIYLDGTMGLMQGVVNTFLKKLKNRVLATIALMGDVPKNTLGPAVCDALNHTLFTKEALSEPLADQIYAFITHKGQLHKLDDAILQLVAEAVSGVAGAKALKQVPIWKMRKQWHLKSLFDLQKEIIPYASTT